MLKHGRGAMQLLPEPSIRVIDAQVVRLARRDWIAVHTPGHTGDHLCLFDPEHGLFVSGDHVLPTITPHIAGVATSADPLAAFFASLQRMHDFEVTTVLPAHGHPFHDLAGRADDIARHHDERLDILRNVGRTELHLGTVAEFMRYLFKERAWGDMAESETFAHLEHLRLLGEATVDRGRRAARLRHQRLINSRGESTSGARRAVAATDGPANRNRGSRHVESVAQRPHPTAVAVRST